MSFQPAKVGLKQVRPLLSTTKLEAKRRVLNLFKQWCRQIENMNVEYEMGLTHNDAVKRIKSEFLKNKNITDIRVVDMLVLKSQNELYDIKNRIRFVCQFHYKFKEDPTPQNKDFLIKFLRGID